MKVALRKVTGNWSAGWVLDKHSQHSTYLGDNAYGHPVFETVRTEVGEATFQLKYRNDWNQVQSLAQQIADSIYPKFQSVGFIVPMPASNYRARQPVTAIAEALGSIVGVQSFNNLLRKGPGPSLKDLNTREEKLTAIGTSFSVHDEITNEGRWNVLLVDDLYHTGASAEVACATLATYPKVKDIYFAALTWR